MLHTYRGLYLLHSFVSCFVRFWLEGRQLRANFGTTKYCATFLRNAPCLNRDCLYLHGLGDEEDRFTKDEIQQRSVVAPPLPSDVPTVTGGGGPSGTGKRCSSPMLPPPVYEAPDGAASSGGVARCPPPGPSATGGTQRSTGAGAKASARPSKDGQHEVCHSCSGLSLALRMFAVTLRIEQATPTIRGDLLLITLCDMLLEMRCLMLYISHPALALRYHCTLRSGLGLSDERHAFLSVLVMCTAPTRGIANAANFAACVDSSLPCRNCKGLWCGYVLAPLMRVPKDVPST